MQFLVVSVNSQRLELVGQVLLEVVHCLSVQPRAHNFDVVHHARNANAYCCNGHTSGEPDFTTLLVPIKNLWGALHVIQTTSVKARTDGNSKNDPNQGKITNHLILLIQKLIPHEGTSCSIYAGSYTDDTKKTSDSNQPVR